MLCSMAAETRQPRAWRSRTSASASRSSATSTARSASRVSRGSLRTDTARPPTSANRRPRSRRSATMRRSAASARLKDATAATRWGGPRRRRAPPPGASRARRPAKPRSPHQSRRDARGEVVRGASTRPSRRGRGLSATVSRERPRSRRPRSHCMVVSGGEKLIPRRGDPRVTVPVGRSCTRRTCFPLPDDSNEA